MNVSSVSHASALLQTSTVSSSSDVSNLTRPVGTDSSGVSSMADFMSYLQSLEESDPTKFKTVMTSLSKQVTEAADSSTTSDGGEAGFLKDMAQKLQEAADTGDVSVLQPPPPDQATQTTAMKALAAYQSNAHQPSVDIAQLIQSTLAQYSA